MKLLEAKITKLIDNRLYNEAAKEFLNKTGAEIEIKYLKNGKHFDDDKDFRDIYEVILSRGNRSYKFNFGQSIAESQFYRDKHITGREYTMSGNSKSGGYNYCISGGYKLTDMKNVTDYCVLVKGTPPTYYDILSSLQKYDVGDFEDFCNEFGYDNDSRKAEKIYKAVLNEYNNMKMLFTDEEFKILSEID